MFLSIVVHNQFFFPRIYSHKIVTSVFAKFLLINTYSPQWGLSILTSRNALFEYKKHIWGPWLMFLVRRIMALEFDWHSSVRHCIYSVFYCRRF